MATRKIYLVNDKEPYYRNYTLDFPWVSGMSVKQHTKCVQSQHNTFYKLQKDKKLLEVSRASDNELGVKLSAFNLLKYVPSLERKVPLECVFQGGNVYKDGGPYPDMYELSPRQAKKDERTNSGPLIAFEFEGKRFPLEPKTAFYDYLYLNALKETLLLL